MYFNYTKCIPTRHKKSLATPMHIWNVLLHLARHRHLMTLRDRLRWWHWGSEGIWKVKVILKHILQPPIAFRWLNLLFSKIINRNWTIFRTIMYMCIVHTCIHYTLAYTGTRTCTRTHIHAYGINLRHLNQITRWFNFQRDSKLLSPLLLSHVDHTGVSISVQTYYVGLRSWIRCKYATDVKIQ